MSNGRNFCSVCAALGIIFVAFEKKSKEMLTTRTNVVYSSPVR